MTKIRRTLFFGAALVAGSLLASGCAPVVVGAAAGGAMVAADRRLPDIMASDERIEWTASGRVTERLGEKVHVNVTSYNRQVLLTGETPTEDLKQQVEKIVAGVPEVRGVINELRIAPPSTLGSRSNDAYLTSNVKARLVGVSEKVNPIHVKVVTEASTVYLMGLVTEKEADAATRVARSTAGVRKVVRAFEYIPPRATQAPAQPAGDKSQ